MAKKSGLSLRGGLPEANGLTPASAGIAEHPKDDVIIVARIHCEDVVHHVGTGTQTCVMVIDEVEIMGGVRERAARDLLDGRRRERRSEQVELERRERAARGEDPLPYQPDDDSDDSDDSPEAGEDTTDDDVLPDPAPAFTEPNVEAETDNVTPMPGPRRRGRTASR